MDVAKYNDLISKIKTDNVDVLMMLKDNINEDSETFRNLENELKQKDEKITELRDSNTKMYLRMTQDSNDVAVVQDDTSINDIVKNWGN